MQLHISPSLRHVTVLPAKGVKEFVKVKVGFRRVSYRMLFYSLLFFVFLLRFVFVLTAVDTIDGETKCSTIGCLGKRLGPKILGRGRLDSMVPEVIYQVLEEPVSQDETQGGPEVPQTLEDFVAEVKDSGSDAKTFALKLKAMITLFEQRTRTAKIQEYLYRHVASSSIPKQLHCLALRLADEHSNNANARLQLPSPELVPALVDNSLFHFVLASDNILAASVVASSLVHNSLHPEKLVFFPVTLDTKSFKNFADFVMGELTAIKLYKTVSTSPIDGRALNTETTLSSSPSSTKTVHLSPLKTPSLTHLKITPFLLLRIPLTSNPMNEYTTSKEPTKPLKPPRLLSSSNPHPGLKITTGFGCKMSVTVFIAATCEESDAINTATSAEFNILVPPFLLVIEEMSMCSTWFDALESKVSLAASVKEGFDHMSKILTEEPFLLMGMSPKTSKASWERERGESWMRGISTLNLGCFSFLSLPVSLGLLRGFSKVVERQVLAWKMASSLEVGGVGEEREQWTEKGGTFDLGWRFWGKNERCE